MEMSRDDLIWYAGFYEGEGTVCTDISNGNRLKVSIAQNDPKPLEEVSKFQGGKVRQRIRKSPASDKICTGHEWSIQGHKAYKFMNDIRPFMRIPYKINQYESVQAKSLVKSERIFQCKQCPKHQNWLPNLARHVRNVHKEQDSESASQAQNQMES